MRSLTELVDGGVVRADGVAASGGRRWWATTVSLVVTVLVLGGCGVVAGTMVNTITPRSVASLAWSADGWVYFIEYIDKAPDTLWRQRRSGDAERLEPDNGDCGYPSYLFVARVVGGTAIVGRRCDRETTELISVSEGRFGAAVARFDSLLEGVAWDLRRDRGFVARRNGYGDCYSLAATSAGIGQFEQELSVDGGRWWADSLFRFGEDFDCESLGDAGWPAFDSTGTKLYFLASAKAAGISEQYDRLLSPASLCVMNVEDERVTQLVSGFSNVRSTAASADGRSVVVSAARDGESGVWLVQMETGRVKRLARGLHGSVDISPDSRTVAAVKLKIHDSIEFIKIR